MTFGECKIGDIFDREEDDYAANVQYIKIGVCVDTDGDYINAICIDKYFDENRGLGFYFDNEDNVSHVNWR